jgi:hypothetical protein
LRFFAPFAAIPAFALTFASLREIFLRSRIGVTVLTKILQFERIILAKPCFF